MIGWYTSLLLLVNLKPLLSNHPPPTLKKKTPRTPPMTPIGVSIASISGKRSSAFAKTAFWPRNSR